MTPFGPCDDDGLPQTRSGGLQAAASAPYPLDKAVESCPERPIPVLKGYKAYVVRCCKGSIVRFDKLEF